MSGVDATGVTRVDATETRMTSIRTLFAALLLVAGAALAQAQTKISVGEVGNGTANHWPAYIASEKGYFKARGVTLDYIAASSSSSVMQQLAAGSIDLGSGGLVDPVRAIDKGAPITLFRTEATVAPYEVYAKKDIKTWADLRGKTIMIGGVKDITRIYFERMAMANGLKSGDYDLVFAGATAQRFSALAGGSIDATIINPPLNFKAKNAGLTRLGATPDYVRDFPFTGYAVSLAWARRHRAEIAGFLAAYQQGVDFFYDKANREEAVTIARKFLKVDRSDVEETYDFFQNLKIFDRVGLIADSGVENLLKILKDFGELDGSTDVARFYDASLTTPDK